jgi:hypothetical protein
MFNRTRVIATIVLVLGVLVSPASGQTDSRLAVGLSVTTGLAPSSSAEGDAGVGFELRIGHESPGWGTQISLFSWFDSGIRQPIATQTVDFGKLRSRPIMAGYGYTWVRDRLFLTADVVGGYSLNSFELAPAALAEYAQRLGATRVNSEATNAFAIKPEIQVWYDLNSRFGIKLNGGYLISRPSVVITSSLGEDVRAARVDRFLITVGAVYSLF